jgi:FkbM family methyltransferase
MNVKEIIYDGYSYITDDNVFLEYIQEGLSEPYPYDIHIVKKYFSMFPHKNKIYIDVGAHIGTTLLPYSKMFQKIIGYEPYHENFNFLKQNIEKNNIENGIIYPYGVYSRHTYGNIIQHSTCNSGCFYFEACENGLIECHTIDEDCAKTGITENVDFIKIDVEGCELFCLQGAENVLRQSKPFLQIAFNNLSDRLYNITHDDIYQYMDFLGYIPFDEKSTNLFFYCPNESLAVVPRFLFCFWLSPFISNERLECIDDIQNKSGVCVKLLTLETIHTYMIPAFPFHKCFSYLSDVHKSDYLRTYIMYFIGGGYTDIKKQQCDWNHSFDFLLENQTLFGIGYPEYIGGVAYESVCKYWNTLIGNGAYIMRPYTVFTKQWFETMTSLLDTKSEMLELHPASHPRDHYDTEKNEYPIGWNEMLGQIFHRLNYLWQHKFKPILISPVI